MDYVNFILTTILLDFLSVFLLKKFFGLSVKVIELILLQILNMAVIAIYLFCEIEFYQFVLLKLVSMFLIVLLVTDSFKFSCIMKLFVFKVLILFSVFGFFEFMTILIETCFDVVFDVKIAKNYKIIVNFAIILYFYSIFALFTKIKKDNFKKNFLSKVSFYMFNKHIEIIGLLDTGNTLRDTKTNKPVMVVSLNVLKKYFGDFDFNNYNLRKIVCEGAGGMRFEMPIIDIGQVFVNSSTAQNSYNCVLGIVNQKFYDEKNYDCLLHRDFV